MKLNVILTRFQFHKGTIRTELMCRCTAETNRFQFHKGTIRTHCFRKCNILIYNRIYVYKVNLFLQKNVDG